MSPWCWDWTCAPGSALHNLVERVAGSGASGVDPGAVVWGFTTGLPTEEDKLPGGGVVAIDAPLRADGLVTG